MTNPTLQAVIKQLSNMGAAVVVIELDDGAATLSIAHDGVESVLHFLYDRQVFPIGGGEYAISPPRRD